MNDNGPPTKRRRLSNDQTDASSSARIEERSLASLPSWKAEQNREQQVGIQVFVNADPQTFIGTLKQRYSDFLVNEILPNGEVVHLTSTEFLKQDRPLQKNLSTWENRPSGTVADHEVEKASPPAVENAPVQQQEETDGSLPDITEEQSSNLARLLNETAAAEVISLYRSIKTRPNQKANQRPTVRTEFTSDRSIRSTIHHFIRQTFQSTIDSSTDQDGILVLTAAKQAGHGKKGHSTNGWHNRPQRPGKLSWIERGGEFLHFTLYKENKDTMEAVSFLAKQLKCNTKNFQFAGTKDRRAVTSQRCSAYRVEAERLAPLNKMLRGSKVGDFAYHREGLELGDLGGNEFVITLRDVKMPDTEGWPLGLEALQQDLQTRMQSLHERGYLNYYGQQRFGTFSVRTDVIGKHILKEDFKGACDAVLTFHQDAVDAALNPESDTIIGQDDKDRALAIHNWRTNNKLNAALDVLPRKFSAEAQIMRHLTRHPTDFLGALSAIQRNLRLMYVHAYQSLVWNLAVTERVKLYGTKIVKGDLVLVSEHKEKQLRPTETTEPSIDADGEEIIEPATHDRAAQEDDVFERARALTEEEAASGKYSIFDIVLPQPGYDILYPDNKSGDFYRTFMSSREGGELDPYNMRRKQRDFSLSGAYRKMLARIGEDYSVEVHRYSEENEQFVKTDLDLIEAAKRIEGESEEQKEMTEKETGDKVAVVLKFQLGPSQYATMALRELSKGGIAPYKPEFSGGR